MDGIFGGFMALQVNTHVTIINFKKFNPRDDVKRPSWFRLEHSLFENPDFYELNHTEKMAWIYLLCVASRKNSESFTLSWPHVEKIGGFKHKDFLQAIEKLQAIQVIHVDVTDALRARDVDVTSANATYVRTNDTNITNDTEKPVGLLPLSPQDLLNLWNENCKTLPKATKLTDSRTNHARAQLLKYPAIDHWTKSLVKFVSSEFCLSKWRPDFDHFLNESKRISALEGRYDRNVESIDRGKKPDPKPVNQSSVVPSKPNRLLTPEEKERLKNGLAI
jgi:hypothetical protein